MVAEVYQPAVQPTQEAAPRGMMALMPELPEVEAVRRRLEPAMRGARIEHVLLRRKDLRQPFPRAFASRLEGRRIRSVDRRGKYLLVALDSGDTVLMHLGMTGSFRIDRQSKRRRSTPEATGDRHDHVVFTLSNGVTVTFNDPRRFGVMDLLGDGLVASHQAFAAMGPEPLGTSFGAAALAQALTGRRTSLKVALLDQRAVAGLGNIYASEALHRAGLSPLRRSSTLATPTGRPTPRVVRLAGAIKTVLREAIARKENPYRAGRFRVYEREGEPCRTAGCRGTIRRITQAGRSTFYCPVCQR
jgi:formamidopyrimidine-DNA glycosylase